MSEVDFDSDREILMAVTGAGPKVQAAGGTLQIVLPDGHLLGYTEHPFAGKKGDELQEALDSVRATWKMRQAQHEAVQRRTRRVVLDNTESDIPSDAELLVAAAAPPAERKRIVVPSAVERDIERPIARGEEAEIESEDPVASVERQLKSAKKRLKSAEQDLDDAQRRYDKAQAQVSRWQRAFNAIDLGDDDE